MPALGIAPATVGVGLCRGEKRRFGEFRSTNLCLHRLQYQLSILKQHPPITQSSRLTLSFPLSSRLLSPYTMGTTVAFCWHMEHEGPGVVALFIESYRSLPFVFSVDIGTST
jgi:hypothetical protein